MSNIYVRRPSVGNLLFGRKLATEEAPHQTISKTIGLAVFASDALSSVAYATQEILIILALAGTAYFGLSIPISYCHRRSADHPDDLLSPDDLMPIQAAVAPISSLTTTWVMVRPLPPAQRC